MTTMIKMSEILKVVGMSDSIAFSWFDNLTPRNDVVFSDVSMATLNRSPSTYAEVDSIF